MLCDNGIYVYNVDAFTTSRTVNPNVVIAEYITRKTAALQGNKIFEKCGAFMCGTKDRIKVLFLCTGNSCRSQIAEGWARHMKSDIIEACSAGVRPIGVSSRAIKVMAEAGVDISIQTSKHTDDLLGVDFDYVVTLCSNVAESCPEFGSKARIIHKPFDDPYFASGSEEQIMAVFRKARDEIKTFVETLPESLTTNT